MLRCWWISMHGISDCVVRSPLCTILVRGRSGFVKFKGRVTVSVTVTVTVSCPGALTLTSVDLPESSPYPSLFRLHLAFWAQD